MPFAENSNAEAGSNGRCSNDANRLIIFLKAPRAGGVKTRLARDAGEEKALRIYCELVESLLENLKRIARGELWVTPDGSEVKDWLPAGWTVRAQGNGGLTERLARAFDAGFGEGAERVVVIGSDCPEVTVADIEEAWKALGNNDVVLGPAADGGYWLVGLRRRLPEIFTDIPWSTEEVLEKTLAIARSLGCKTHLLRTLNDVDTVADWERFQRLRQF
jgi:rSAM/selenodomain-associated transferase 1